MNPQIIKIKHMPQGRTTQDEQIVFKCPNTLEPTHFFTHLAALVSGISTVTSIDILFIIFGTFSTEPGTQQVHDKNLDSIHYDPFLLGSRVH